MDSTVSFVLGAVAGFFINKVLETGTSIATNKFSEKRLKKRLEKIESIDKELNIVTLSSGFPKYNLNNGITIKNSDKKLYIDFPEEKKGLINREIKFNSDCSFNGGVNYEDIVKQTGIDNLVELINKYRNKVADEFINKTNGCYFNGEKYGVYSIDANDRRGMDEEPIVRLEIFQTDYFTHKIFREIYKELAEQNHDISKVKSADELKKYNAFNTSLGINGIVKVNSKEGKNSFILTKRSKNVTTKDNKEWYATSFIEGISQTDYDLSKKAVSLLTGIKRGLEEELGIPEGFYSNDKVDVYDFFLEREFFEIGMTCSITLDEKLTFEENVEILRAKDKTLETAEIFTIKNSSDNIKKFLKDKKEEIYSRSAYTINSIAIREYLNNIFI